jgi:hypothetical protein
MNQGLWRIAMRVADRHGDHGQNSLCAVSPYSPGVENGDTCGQSSFWPNNAMFDECPGATFLSG